MVFGLIKAVFFLGEGSEERGCVSIDSMHSVVGEIVVCVCV